MSDPRRISFAVFALILCAGCGQEEAVQPEVDVQTLPVVAPKPVVAPAVTTPNFTWTIPQVLTGFLTASQESRADFVVEDNRDQVAGWDEPSRAEDEFELDPLLKNELYPNESLNVIVRFAGGITKTYIVTRTETGYRVDLSQTRRYRENVAHECFLNDYELHHAQLVVRLVKFQRVAERARLRLEVTNRSKASLVEYSLSVKTFDQGNHEVSTNELPGENLGPNKTQFLEIKLTGLPEGPAACRFEVAKAILVDADKQRRDVTEHFDVEQVRQVAGATP